MKFWRKKVEPLTASETHQLMKADYKRGQVEELNRLRDWLGQQAEFYQGEANRNPDRKSAMRMAEQASVLYRVRASVFARILRVEGREIDETEEAIHRLEYARSDEEREKIRAEYPEHSCPGGGFVYMGCPGCDARIDRYLKLIRKDNEWRNAMSTGPFDTPVTPKQEALIEKAWGTGKWANETLLEEDDAE